jgi:hypothetical protein
MESITLLTSRGFYFFVKARRIGAGGSIGAAVKRIGSDGFVLTLLVASGLPVNQKLR